MPVDVDGLDRVMRAAVKADQLLNGEVPRRIQTAVGAAVEHERRSHPYTNRTGNAERSTVCRATVDGAEARMGVHYASVLNARGWSEFQVWMDNANAEIHEAIDDVSDRL